MILEDGKFEGKNMTYLLTGSTFIFKKNTPNEKEKAEAAAVLTDGEVVEYE